MIAKFKKTSRIRSAGAALLVAVLACVALTDAYPAEPPLTFGTPTNLGPPVNTAYSDGAASITRDGLSLYFGSSQAGGYGPVDIWVATRPTTDDPWDEPKNLGPTVNSSSVDAAPYVSPDNLALFFMSNRVGGYGDVDIWVASRATVSVPWGPPTNLGPAVNSALYDGTPFVTDDGLRLYFCSYRTDGYGGGDLWFSTRPTKESLWTTPVNLGPTVNSLDSEFFPYASLDGLTLLFGSDRRGGYGDNDIWMSTRPATSEAWAGPVNLGPNLNTSSIEDTPRLSYDGSTLYFTSDRPGGVGLPDVWQVPVFWEPACGDEDHPYPTGDLNQDCRVDYADLAVLCAHWLDDNNP